MLKHFNRNYAVKVDLLSLDITHDSKAMYFDTDKNTATLVVQLQLYDKPFTLEGCSAYALVETMDGTKYRETAIIIDPEQGAIGVDIKAGGLTVGTNKIQLILTDELGDVLYVPYIVYKVYQGIDGDISDEQENVSIIMSLVDQVGKASERVDKLEKTMERAETVRESQEKDRVQHEIDRKVKFAELEVLIENKLIKVNSKLTEMDEKLEEIDSKATNQINEKSEELTKNIQNTLDEKIKEVDTAKVELSENIKSTLDKKIKEVDIVETELTTNVSNKISEADSKIENVEGRMKHIESNFDKIVNGSGYASLEFVEKELEKKSEKVHRHKIEDIDNLSMNWKDLEDVPTEFKPASHEHDDRYYTKTQIDEMGVGNGVSENFSNTTEVTEEQWVKTDDNMYVVSVAHGLKTDKVLVYVTDTETKESIVISKRYVDENTIELKDVSPSNLTILTINGGIPIVEKNSGINDAIVSKSYTWSSFRIQEELKKSSVNGSVSDTLEILESQWVLNEDGFYEVSSTHKLKTDKVLVSAYDAATKENLLISFKSLDKNTILFKNTKAINMNVLLLSGGIPTTSVGANINDSEISESQTWSSYKLNEIVQPLTEEEIVALFNITGNESNPLDYYTKKQSDEKYVTKDEFNNSKPSDPSNPSVQADCYSKKESDEKYASKSEIEEVKNLLGVNVGNLIDLCNKYIEI